MDTQALLIAQQPLISLLNQCVIKKDRRGSRQLYTQIIEYGFDLFPAFGIHLIHLFTSCGSLLDVNRVFSKVTKPSIYAWSALISANVKFGNNAQALELYNKMQLLGIKPNKYLLSCVLKTCGAVKCAVIGMRVQDEILRMGLEIDVILGNALLHMYSKCLKLKEMEKVFTLLTKRDVVSWSVIIAAYTDNGHGHIGLHLLKAMQDDGIEPDKATFLCILKACGSLGDVRLGMVVHNHITISESEMKLSVVNMLVDMYVKCGCLEEARILFDKMAQHDVVTWGAMLLGYVHYGYPTLALEFFCKMELEDVKPNNIILVCALKCCGSLGALKQGKEIHDAIIRDKLELDVPVGNALIDMYAKCRSLQEAYVVFTNLLGRDHVSWAILLWGYAQAGDGLIALELFQEMQLDCMETNAVILSSVLKACNCIGGLFEGRLVHIHTIKAGYESDPVIGNSLMDVYARCGNLVDAYEVFLALPYRNLVSFGVMIAGYTLHGLSEEAFKIFIQMQDEDVQPNAVILSCILKACGNLGALELGKLTHEQIVRNEVESDTIISNSLIDMYMRCHTLEEAQNVFGKLLTPDIISWGTIIMGLCQHGHDFRALVYFIEMQSRGLETNNVIVMAALKACSSVGSVQIGKLIHCQIVTAELDSDLDIANTLLYMYSKCGSLQDACKVFHGMSVRDGGAWGVMAVAYAQHGQWELCGQCLKALQERGPQLSGVVNMNILSAYGQLGQVEGAQSFFNNTIHGHGIKHFNSLVDLLARTGHLKTARFFLETIPIPTDVSGWTSLLSSCKLYGDQFLAEESFDILRTECSLI